MSAKGNLKQADASGTGKHAARHMRIDARRKPSVGPGAGRLSRRADQGKRRGRDNPSVRLGTKGQPEAPGPREKRDYRWQWRRGSPVSIPNTEVKPFSADGTWRVTARKSRSLPVLHHDTLCLKAGSIILKILPITAPAHACQRVVQKPGNRIVPKERIAGRHSRFSAGSAITGGNGEGDHLYPSRTQKLSPSAPMVLGG